jgi:3-phosphoglycerate kinase
MLILLENLRFLQENGNSEKAIRNLQQYTNRA